MISTEFLQFIIQFAQVANNVKSLIAIKDKAKEVRAAQAFYFRNKSNLNEAKKLEKELDEMIEDLDNPKPKQKELF